MSRSHPIATLVTCTLIPHLCKCSLPCWHLWLKDWSVPSGLLAVSCGPAVNTILRSIQTVPVSPGCQKREHFLPTRSADVAIGAALLPGELPTPFAISTHGAWVRIAPEGSRRFWDRAGFVSVEERQEGSVAGKDRLLGWGRELPSSPVSAMGNRHSFSEREQMPPALW